VWGRGYAPSSRVEDPFLSVELRDLGGAKPRPHTNYAAT